MSRETWEATVAWVRDALERDAGKTDIPTDWHEDYKAILWADARIKELLEVAEAYGTFRKKWPSLGIAEDDVKSVDAALSALEGR